MNSFKFRLQNHFLLVAIISFSLLYAAFGQTTSQAVNFRKKEIQVGKAKVIVEVAQTDAERAVGLMHRKSMPDGYGMIFLFETERPLNFWMKNTIIP